MNQFGVKNPTLKSIAKTLEIPAIQSAVEAPTLYETIPQYWLGGIRLRNRHTGEVVTAGDAHRMRTGKRDHASES